MRLGIALVAMATVLIAFGCSDSGDKGHDHDHDQDHDHSAEAKDKHSHHHKAPHGGTLVVLGKEFAHLEFVLDEQTGKLSAYALDAEAEKSVMLSQPSLELTVDVGEVKSGGTSGSSFTLQLKPVVSTLTGESAKETSEYSAESDNLKSVRSFKAVLKSVELKGQRFDSVQFPFPEGNE